MRMWLVQRGEIKHGKFEGLMGEKGLVELDYMGSAEFEFGAIPKAYIRIMGNYFDYVFHKTSIVDVKGNPLWIYAHKSKLAEVEECIKAYARKPYPFELKEMSYMEYHLNERCLASLTSPAYYLRRDFWWDIQNDWMAFVGAKHVRQKFKKAIDYDCANWWLEMSDEERVNELREAYRW